jgi:hypothetical protein
VGKDQSLPDAFAGSPYSYTLSTLNGAGPAVFAADTFNPLPPGLILSSNGLISGIPTVAGFFSLNFTINDGTDTVFTGIGLNIGAVQITNPGMLPNATVGSAYSVTLTGTGGALPYTFSAFLPAGLSLDASTGVISGTVAAGSASGRFNFYANLTDGNGASYSKAMAIDTLNPPVTTGYLTPYGGLWDDCTIGLGCSRGASLFAGGTAPFTWTVTGLPPGMATRTGSGVTASYIWPGDLELWGTPTVVGLYSVSLTVTDANLLSTTQIFPLRVSALIVDGADFLPSGTRGTPYSKTLRLLGGAGPYSVTLLPTSTMPAGLSLSGLVVGGTPTENGFNFSAMLSFSDSAGNSLRVQNSFAIDPTVVNINNAGSLGAFQLNAPFSCVPSMFDNLGVEVPFTT